MPGPRLAPRRATQGRRAAHGPWAPQQVGGAARPGPGPLPGRAEGAAQVPTLASQTACRLLAANPFRPAFVGAGRWLCLPAPPALRHRTVCGPEHAAGPRAREPPAARLRAAQSETPRRQPAGWTRLSKEGRQGRPIRTGDVGPAGSAGSAVRVRSCVYVQPKVSEAGRLAGCCV